MPIISKLEFYGIALLIIGLAMGAAYIKGKHEGMTEVQAKFDLFTAQVKSEGEKARADALQKEKDDEKKIAAAVTSRDAALASLRVASARPRGGFVSSSATTPAGGSRVCYDGKALDAALRVLDTGVSGFVTEGDTQVINAATLLKSWPSPNPVSGQPMR